MIKLLVVLVGIIFIILAGQVDRGKLNPVLFGIIFFPPAAALLIHIMSTHGYIHTT